MTNKKNIRSFYLWYGSNSNVINNIILTLLGILFLYLASFLPYISALFITGAGLILIVLLRIVNNVYLSYIERKEAERLAISKPEEIMRSQPNENVIKSMKGSIRKDIPHFECPRCGEPYPTNTMHKFCIICKEPLKRPLKIKK